MKLVDVEEAKSYYSGKTSDITRQLSLAGIAVVWLLRNEHSVIPIPPQLIPVLICFVSALALDMLHYAMSTFTWTRYYYQLKAQGVGEDEKFGERPRINWLGYSLFALKIFAFLFGAVLLICYLAHRWAWLT